MLHLWRTKRWDSLLLSGNLTLASTSNSKIVRKSRKISNISRCFLMETEWIFQKQNKNDGYHNGRTFYQIRLPVTKSWTRSEGDQRRKGSTLYTHPQSGECAGVGWQRASVTPRNYLYTIKQKIRFQTLLSAELKNWNFIWSGNTLHPRRDDSQNVWKMHFTPKHQFSNGWVRLNQHLPVLRLFFSEI